MIDDGLPLDDPDLPGQIDTRNRFPDLYNLYDLYDLYDLAHVAGRDPCNVHDL